VTKIIATVPTASHTTIWTIPTVRPSEPVRTDRDATSARFAGRTPRRLPKKPGTVETSTAP
jgi:hypothetical protein